MTARPDRIDQFIDNIKSNCVTDNWTINRKDCVVDFRNISHEDSKFITEYFLTNRIGQEMKVRLTWKGQIITLENRMV